MGRLDGKVAVITGSGRGIGKAAAKLFAQEGACVVVSDIDRDPAEETAREIAAAGGKAAVYVGDLRKPEEAQKLMDTAVEKFGKLDILVNNAGIIRDALVNKMTDEQWNVCLDINLRTSFNCTRAAAKYMMKQGHNGRVIFISSLAGLMGNMGQVNYSAAKGGQIAMAKTLAKEWARFGIKCNAIAYGGVHTRLTGEKETAELVLGEKVGVPKVLRDQVMAGTGGAWMTPEEAARPILFFASEDAAFITGNVLNVSNGLYI